jgi:hypothetical protein
MAFCRFLLKIRWQICYRILIWKRVMTESRISMFEYYYAFYDVDFFDFRKSWHGN